MPHTVHFAHGIRNHKADATQMQTDSTWVNKWQFVIRINGIFPCNMQLVSENCNFLEGFFFQCGEC